MGGDRVNNAGPKLVLIQLFYLFYALSIEKRVFGDVVKGRALNLFKY